VQADPVAAHLANRNTGDYPMKLGFIGLGRMGVGMAAEAENAGLISSERRGQFIHYSLIRDSLVNTLNGYLQEVCPVSRPLKRESARLAKGKS
jgi:hypothetical protein